MKIFKSKHKLQKALSNQKSLSFVPTMGGLHKGHISLIKKSKKFKEKVIVSIFINPKQFNKKKDFTNYPRNLKKDLSVLKKLRVNIVFIPNKKDIFSFRPKSSVYLNSFSKKLCGQFRKGHFEGVLNVVNRFLEIIKPKRIFLGNKDFQQLVLIKKHILKKKINTKIVSCKTVRERNGIAYSTRNSLLSINEIKIASKIYRILSKEKKKLSINLKKVKEKIIDAGGKNIDYLEIYNINTLKKSNKLNKNTKLFIAYYLNNVRLIDNL